jgi:chemotaxis protein methyltransferase CheR
VTEEELARLCDFLYRRTGMVFNEAKRYYVERRVAERMAATRSTSFPGYLARLRADTDSEVEHFINAFTVNETYFYREDHQLRCLTNNLLGEVIQSKPYDASVRIWSAPCATGEEPYSIAIWLLENWPQVDAYEVEIIGSDIDTNTLEAARQGLFGNRAFMRLPQDLRERYFVAEGDNEWRIIEQLRDSIRFTQVNLVDRAQTAAEGKFDIIFCRNVLIYFDDASRRLAAENIYDRLNPGGFVCLGHSESMSRISPLFEVHRYSDAIVYRKPLGDARG